MASPQGRSKRSSPASPLYTHSVKLLFFVLTFLVFIILQNSIVYIEVAWQQLHSQLSGAPWWIVAFALVGTLPVGWVLFLGIEQCIRRLSASARSKGRSYKQLDSDSESDSFSDVEEGHYRHGDFSRKKNYPPSRTGHSSTAASQPLLGPGNGRNLPAVHQTGQHGHNKQHGYAQQASAGTTGGGPPNGHGFAGQTGLTGERNEPQNGESPTDVDVTVHPVDTTIAAGGETRVSPTYNVSLMSFSNEPPTQVPPTGAFDGTSRVYPSAPAMMQGGPAYFKRTF